MAANSESILAYLHLPSKRIVFNIVGPGLWGKIYGLLSLNSDLTSYSFYVYKHEETPGLGGKIGTKEWRERWLNVKLLDSSLDPVKPIDVSAISGATMTSRAVEKVIISNLTTLKPVLKVFYEGNIF
jgi:Na+-transporting NADH:ubiquinone oxidoreductase subunit C